MTSFYSVVQYVPDPIADERINIGVIAYSGSTALAQFLTEWRRVKSFGGEDIHFLKDFARRLQRSISRQSAGLSAGQPPVESSDWERMATSWHNSIQLTPARASLKAPDALLREAVRRFLSEPVRSFEDNAPRDHQSARDLARSRVRRVVQDLVGDAAEGLTRDRFSLEGEKARHTFDIAVANGVPYLAAQAVSLERGMSKQLITTLDAIAWTVSDTHVQQSALPLGVIMLPPRPTSPNFVELESVRSERTVLYRSLGAEVLAEDDVENWTRRVLEASLPH